MVSSSHRINDIKRKRKYSYSFLSYFKTFRQLVRRSYVKPGHVGEETNIELCYFVEQGVAKGPREENRRSEIETWSKECSWHLLPFPQYL